MLSFNPSGLCSHDTSIMSEALSKLGKFSDSLDMLAGLGPNVLSLSGVAELSISNQLCSLLDLLDKLKGGFSLFNFQKIVISTISHAKLYDCSEAFSEANLLPFTIGAMGALSLTLNGDLGVGVADKVLVLPPIAYAVVYDDTWMFLSSGILCGDTYLGSNGFQLGRASKRWDAVDWTLAFRLSLINDACDPCKTNVQVDPLKQVIDAISALTGSVSFS